MSAITVPLSNAAISQSNETIAKRQNDSNEKIANQNLDFEREKLQYDMDLQQQIFQREDTAYQRTVNDMRKAGVSPLAMQGTNGAGEAVATTAPHNDMQYDYSGLINSNTALGQALASSLPTFESITQGLNNLSTLKEKNIENNFKEKSLQLDYANRLADVISKSYDNLGKKNEYNYNKMFGINSSMTESERKWAIMARALGLVSDTPYSGEKHFDYDGLNIMHNKFETEHRPYSADSYSLGFLGKELGAGFADFAAELLKGILGKKIPDFKKDNNP